MAKVFHVPSDNLVVASTYIARPSYDMTSVKAYQRNTANRELQEENQKVLARIVGSKPSINVDELIKHERAYKKLKKMHKNQFRKAIHGYPARGPEEFCIGNL